MNWIREWIERIKRGIEKGKQAMDTISRVIEIITGIVMSVMLGLVGIKQNMDMAQQEANFEALQRQLNAKAQAPAFRMLESYSGEDFMGYALLNDGRMVTSMDVRLEKWLHVQIMGDVDMGFIVPYNAVNLYVSAPTEQEVIGFFVERAAVQELPTEEPATDVSEELPMQEEEQLVRVNLMDAKPFAGTLEAKFRENGISGYSIRSIEVMKLSFVDTEKAYETRRYFIGAQTQETKSGIERPLYQIDGETWTALLAQIPAEFERLPESLNGGIYSHLAQAGLGWRQEDGWQEALQESIVGYIANQTAPAEK